MSSKEWRDGILNATQPQPAAVVLPTVDEVVDIIKEGGFYSDTARAVLGLIAARLPVWQPVEPGTVIKAGTRVRRPYLTDSGAVEHILPTDTPANDGWCIDPRTVPAEPVDPRAELLAEELHKLVADFQANGNSRELGDPTAGAWFEAAQQILDALNNQADR